MALRQLQVQVPKRTAGELQRICLDRGATRVRSVDVTRRAGNRLRP